MLAAYTRLHHAQEVKNYLIKHKILNHDCLPVKELDLIYFPLSGKAKLKTKVPHAKVTDTKFSFPHKDKPKTVEELLKNNLTAKQLELLPKSQEIVGKILILEVPEQLEKKEQLIAEAYLSLNPQVETVVKKTAIHSGVYRTRKVKILAGRKTKETTHYENGIKLLLHLERTYYSARSGAERLRVAKQIKKGEDVLVMFSGAAPYPLVIARNSDANKITGIEINPLAHRYAIDSVILNKLENKIHLLEGDVTRILPKMRKKFHRIAMPLPKTGEEFLNIALPKLKDKGTIHLYGFLNEKEINKHASEVKKKCKELGYNVRVKSKIKCGQFSPGTYRVCFDLQLVK